MSKINEKNVIAELESEIEQLKEKLRKSYDQHSATVEKFDHDMALLKRELTTAYQLSASLTREKATLEGIASNSPEFASQVDDQLRLLTIELKKANEERRRAEEHLLTRDRQIDELSARLAAAENVAKKYFVPVSDVTPTGVDVTDENGRQESGAIKSRSWSVISGLLAAKTVKPAVAAETTTDTGAVSQPAELLARLATAEQINRDYLDTIGKTGEQLAAAQREISRLDQELKKHAALKTRPTGAPGTSQGTDDSEKQAELEELRSRIEAAEYILADYQARLKQAEIDRDEATRELDKLGRSRGLSRPQAVTDDDNDVTGIEQQVAALQQQLEQSNKHREMAEQGRQEIETELKRSRSRMQSAEKVASTYMSRLKQADTELQNMRDQIADLHTNVAVLEKARNEIAAELYETFREQLNNAEVDRTKAQQEAGDVRRELGRIKDQYETLKQEYELLETERGIVAAHKTDEQDQMTELLARIEQEHLERQHLEKKLEIASTERDRLRDELDATANIVSANDSRQQEAEREHQRLRQELADQLDSARTESTRLEDQLQQISDQEAMWQARAEQAEKSVAEQAQQGQATLHAMSEHDSRRQETELEHQRLRQELTDRLDKAHAESARLEGQLQQISDQAAMWQARAEQAEKSVVEQAEQHQLEAQHALQQAISENELRRQETGLEHQRLRQELTDRLDKAHAESARLEGQLQEISEQTAMWQERAEQAEKSIAERAQESASLHATQQAMFPLEQELQDAEAPAERFSSEQTGTKTRTSAQHDELNGSDRPLEELVHELKQLQKQRGAIEMQLHAAQVAVDQAAGRTRARGTRSSTGVIADTDAVPSAMVSNSKLLAAREHYRSLLAHKEQLEAHEQTLKRRLSEQFRQQ